jgi:hypothetical protein
VVGDRLGGDDFWFAAVLDPRGISLGLWTSRDKRRPEDGPADVVDIETLT